MIAMQLGAVAGWGQSQVGGESGSRVNTQNQYAFWKDKTGRVAFQFPQKGYGALVVLTRSQGFSWVSRDPSSAQARPFLTLIGVYTC